MSAADVIALIRQRAAEAGSVAAWCREIGVNYSQMMTILHGRRPPCETVLRVLGLRKVVSYERGRVRA